MLDFVHFPFQNPLKPDLAGVKHEVDQLLVSGRDNTDVSNLGGIYMETKPFNGDDYFDELLFCVVDEN